MYNKLVNKEAKLALVGLGYVGLPIALEFAKKISVIGFDINEERLAKMRQGIDPCKELDHAAFEEVDIKFTSSIDELREASFFIVAVPTPIDRHNQPDLTPLLSATRSVAHALKRGDYVVYESTVYPGCTEEDCLPILEEISGLKAGVDFKIGYSPERINPGEKVHTLPNTIKIVSGCDGEALDVIAKVYELVVKPGVHRAPNIKVAEAAKIIENTQRDVNIALMNELSIIFSRIGINTYDVLEAAGTKWNFLPFRPGLVGGHCIGVDPYYLIRKAQDYGYHPGLILYGRRINDTMGEYIANRVVKCMIKKDVPVKNAEVLVLGFTFKENCPDVRNTKVGDVVRVLKDYGINVSVYDPWARAEEVRDEYGIELTGSLSEGRKYDVIVLAVAHKEFLELDIPSLVSENHVVYDVKGCLNPEWVDDRL